MKKNNRIVIKVGTKVITSKDRTLDALRMKDLVRQISCIQDKGVKVILVTSGAIGAGLSLLGMKKRPSRLNELQATASIGQSHLMGLYGEYFKERGYLVGQILLTQEDFNDRARYLNIKHTIDTLLAHNAVPVINENDTVATEEIKCGDNDRLSSLVGDLCQADKLVILTDVDGLLDEKGSVISLVEEITPKILKLCGRQSHCDLGTGGMGTKIESAKRAMSSGIECIVANGKKEDIILKIMNGESVGTVFKSLKAKLIARKRWIAYSSKPSGSIKVDDGAKLALSKNDKSLLASGIAAVSGSFKRGDVVKIVDGSNKEFGRGIANYSSDDVSKIRGLKSGRFKDILGFKGTDEVIHRDNLVIL